MHVEDYLRVVLMTCMSSGVPTTLSTSAHGVADDGESGTPDAHMPKARVHHAYGIYDDYAWTLHE